MLLLKIHINICSCQQLLALILMLHGGVRVQGQTFACFLLLGVQNLDAVGKLAGTIDLLVLLYLCIGELLLAL